MAFAVPSKLAGKFPADYEDALVAIQVTSVEQMETVRGEATAIVGTATICSGPLTGAVVDATVFNKNLVAQLRNNVGQIVLGRLARKQAGGFMSWELTDPTPEDVTAASAVVPNF